VFLRVSHNLVQILTKKEKKLKAFVHISEQFILSYSKVHIGLPEVEEEVEDGKVMHADQSSMTVNWRVVDYQSGTVKAWVAIGISTNDTSVTKGFKEYFDGNVAHLSG
jgi:hypothetical protein